MNSIVGKPSVWIGLGCVLGATAFGLVIAQSPRAHAGPETVKPSTIASITTENMTALRTLDQSFASLAEAVEPAVVHIRSGADGGRDESGKRIGRIGGEGSGFIFRSDGWIITNDHVVSGSDTVTVVLSDGREFEGTVRRANDIQNDIAVIKIDGKGEQFPTAPLADSRTVRTGQFAIAVGSPFGLENSVTIGHVSALGRNNMVVDPTFGNRGYSNLIQTDAAINPGNSGGPLMNIEGEVIGINSSIVGGSSGFGQAGNVGIGFAIPSNQARLIAEILIEKGKLTRAYMGLAPEDLKPFEQKKYNLSAGAIVRNVPSNGPAAAGGLKENDIITRIGTIDIRGQQDLRNAMFQIAPGTKSEVQYVRNGEKKSTQVTMAALPKDMQAQLQKKDIQLPGNLDGDTQKQLDKLRKQWESQIPDIKIPNLDDNSPKGETPKREGPVRLGVGLGAITSELRTQFSIPENVEGAVVGTVEPGSVAERIGLKAGDVITQIGDQKIKSSEDVVAALKDLKWGDTRQLSYTRYSKGSQNSMSFPVQFR